ncbi:hypothetical protein ANCDUO_21980, partial [Ancylostoma duodenale]
MQRTAVGVQPAPLRRLLPAPAPSSHLPARIGCTPRPGSIAAPSALRPSFVAGVNIAPRPHAGAREVQEAPADRNAGRVAQGFPGKREVLGDTFLTDPTSEGHVCMTVDLLKDKVERRTHEKCLQVRNDARYAACSTNEILEDMLQEYEDDVSLGTAEERAAMRLHFHRRSLDSRRRTVERSKEAHKDKMVTWNSVPPSLANLGDGSVFLQ